MLFLTPLDREVQIKKSINKVAEANSRVEQDSYMDFNASIVYVCIPFYKYSELEVVFMQERWEMSI